MFGLNIANKLEIIYYIDNYFDSELLLVINDRQY